MALHKNLTGAAVHEPKGIEDATSGQVYKADGSGSGSWQTITIPSGTFRKTSSYFTSSGTWTKPSNCFGVEVHVLGAGGGGSDSYSGGAGGYTSSWWEATSLSATESVVVGAAGAATGGLDGSTGGSSAFKATQSNGGTGGTSSANGTGGSGNAQANNNTLVSLQGGASIGPYGYLGYGTGGGATNDGQTGFVIIYEYISL